MKFIAAVFLFSMISLSQTAPIFPATDYIYDTYAYQHSQITSTVGASFGDYAVVDDFTFSGSVYGYTCWGVTTAGPPFELELMLVPDGGGAPQGGPASTRVYAAGIADSGFSFAGYTVWIAELNLSPSPLIEAGTWWLGSKRTDGSNWYPMAGTTVSGSEAHRTLSAGWSWQPYSQSIEEGDLFKIIESTPPSSLERQTWAGIKLSF